MPKYFTKAGMQLFQGRISAQRTRIERAQRDAGEAAGPSYDWHDNFGYEEARRRTEMEANRLQELLSAAQGAIVFEPVEQREVVRIGNTVSFWHSGTSRDQEVTIGGYGELDQDTGLISYESPIGQALLGKKENDIVHLEIGGEPIDLMIKKIFPPSYRYEDLIAQLAEKATTPVKLSMQAEGEEDANG